MTTLTHAGIRSVLGRVDHHLAAELVGSGATLEELTEAKAWVNNDEPMINAGRPLATARVGILVRLLMRAEEDDAPAVTATDGDI